jgi:hypothetical protein
LPQLPVRQPSMVQAREPVPVPQQRAEEPAVESEAV